MLTDRDLERGRADILETMPDTSVIYRSTNSTNAYGEGEPAFAAVGTVPVRVDPGRLSDKQIYAEREGGAALFQLTNPYDTALQAGDRQVVNAITYEMIEVHDSHSDRLVVRSVGAKVSD